jgi:hypothetical protein
MPRILGKKKTSHNLILEATNAKAVAAIDRIPVDSRVGGVQYPTKGVSRTGRSRRP